MGFFKEALETTHANCAGPLGLGGCGNITDHQISDSLVDSMRDTGHQGRMLPGGQNLHMCGACSVLTSRLVHNGNLEPNYAADVMAFNPRSGRPFPTVVGDETLTRSSQVHSGHWPKNIPVPEISK